MNNSANTWEMNDDQAESLAVKWTQSQSAVAAFILSVVKDHHATEEIFSRVTITLVRTFENYDSSKSFTAWAIGIAKNEIRKSQCSYAKERHHFSSELIEKISARYEASVGESDPRMLYLEECLKRIQGHARQALALRYVSDMKPAKIAESLQVSGGAARMLLTRTRKAIRNCIERRLAERGA